MPLSGSVRLVLRGSRQYHPVLITPLTHPLKGMKSPDSCIRLNPQDVELTKLHNGLVIAALENYSPVAKVGIFLKAGSRYEDAGNLGITHCLRVASNMSSKKASPFKLTRAIEAVGGSLRVISTRDLMLYTVGCLRDSIDDLMEYLSAIVLAPEFRPWEVASIRDRLKVEKEIAYHQLQRRMLENLHAAAYRNTLCNSLYCPDFMLGQFTCEQLHKYVKKHFCVGQMAIVGIGMTLSQLTKAAQQLFGKASGYGQAGPKALYGGGEHREGTSEPLVHAAVVCEGEAVSSQESLAFTALQQVLGVGPHVKRGSGMTSTLTRAISKSTAQPFTASAFNVCYQDSGLFGVYTISQDEAAADVINAAVSHLKHVADGKISEEDIERGKNQLIARNLMAMETLDTLLEEMGLQILTTGTYISPISAVDQIKEISKKDVVKAAEKFASGTKSMAVCGRLASTPFLDEL
ncbi:cytochrome b-c1 complex subunit 2, mitochondrial-like isoform X2 [Chiloscyllium plagiosum]|uniref:cytochrome b-c1 complex subunit 2, mitochondrial-like isoform X2 n=1 Tax=Chiloscyllium plagiosum TaxID=36176 RepID=UPI001CB87AC1|nr:cytochrome b-c1 complex subunit 2, mitochondrial-like isoform X2 [Chiloscyllium plagiosum]